jgi:hypothetical protein
MIGAALHGLGKLVEVDACGAYRCLEPHRGHAVDRLRIDYIGRAPLDDHGLVFIGSRCFARRDKAGAQISQVRAENFGCANGSPVCDGAGKQAQQCVPRLPAQGRALSPVLELMRDGYAERLSLEQMGLAAKLTPFQW